MLGTSEEASEGYGSVSNHDELMANFFAQVSGMRCVRNELAILNHALMKVTYIFDARIAGYIHTRPYSVIATFS